MSDVEFQELPEGWANCRLPDVAQIVMGQSPPGTTYNDSGDGLPFFQGKSDFNERYPTVRKWCNAPTKIAEPGDVLISIRAPVGPTNLADRTCAIGRGLAAIRKTDATLTELLLFAIRMQEAELAEQGTGSTFTAINRDHLNAIELRLPPLAEQGRIVAKVEELLARANAARDRLLKAPAILKRFRQSVLAAACSGQLTTDWRESRQSVQKRADFLHMLLHDRKKRISQTEPTRGQYREPVTIENSQFGRPEAPAEWEWATLEQVSWRLTYGITVRPAYVTKGVEIISAREVRSGEVDLGVANRISEADYGQLRDKCKLRENDILFSKTGTIGSVARIKVRKPLCVSQNVALISPLIEPAYLEIVLRSPFIREAAESCIKDTAIPDLQLGYMAQFPIPLPQPVEQKEIVRRVEALFALADKIGARVQDATARVDKITQAILAKAFRGELVPTEAELARQEGRDYEPASVLLDRIRATREVASANGAAPRRKPKPAAAKSHAAPKAQPSSKTRKSKAARRHTRAKNH